MAAGYHCATPEEVRHRIEEGWQFLAIGSELKFMMNGTAEVLKKIGASRAGGDIAKY